MAVLVVPAAISGGLAFGGSTEGTMELRPGGSAVADSEVKFVDGQASVTYVLPGRPVSNSLYLGLELRRTSETLYRAKARVFPDGTVTVDVSRARRGVEEHLGSRKIAARVGTGTTSLVLEGVVEGKAPTALAVRARLAGMPASGWQYAVSDTAPFTADGTARAWSYLSRSATEPMTLRFRDLSATPRSDAPKPIPSIPTQAPTPKPTPSTEPTPAPTATSPSPDPEPSTPPAPPKNRLEAVLAASGADSQTNYPVPGGAVFVAPNGDDGADGSQGYPVSSIAKAIQKAPAGGTVVLRGGTYRQAVGTVHKRITLQAYPRERPVLSGADVVRDWTASGNVWRTSSWRTPFGQNDFRAEEVPSGSAAGKVEQAYRNGSPLTQVLKRDQLSSGKFWVDPSSRMLYVADDPRGVTMELSTRTRGLTLDPGAGGSVLRGLRFTAYAPPHLDNSGQLMVNGAAGTRIEHSVFDHSSGAGLKISGPDITVVRSTVRDNAAEGMQGNRNDGSVVKNNQFNRNNTDGFKVHLCGASCTIAGFKAAHTDDLTVTDNAFVGNEGNGFWCDLGCTDVSITGNAVSGGYDGIFYEVSSRGKIENNYVENADKGIRIAGSDHTTIRNNTLVNNNWQLTMYDDRRSSSEDGYSGGLGLSWNTTDVTIKDNRIVGGSKTTRLLEANAHQVASPQMYRETAGNSVAGEDAMVWCQSAGQCRTYGSIAEWRKASGRGF